VRQLNVIVGCERSGVVAGAFRKRGHNAYSCDLLKAADDHPCPEFHLQCDVREALRWKAWDLGIFHPDCTYLCGSGYHWVARGRIEADGRPRSFHVEEALAFVDELFHCGLPHWLVENSRGIISSRLRPYSQTIQPHQFGHDASKQTDLWMHNLPLLVPTQNVEPRWVQREGKRPLPRWANQTDSGQNRLPPTADRWELRARTYEGIADAMADQFSRFILSITAPDEQGKVSA
jgi:hypothetical protein